MREADDVTRLLDRPDFENHDSLMITNIIDNSSRYANALTIVVNRNLPQFVKDAASGTYVESTTRNIFTTRIQLNAILKGQGEPMLANAVMTAPLPVLLVLFKKARISVLGHVLGAGEIFVNPYASKMAREERVNEHDRYDISRTSYQCAPYLCKMRCSYRRQSPSISLMQRVLLNQLAGGEETSPTKLKLHHSARVR